MRAVSEHRETILTLYAAGYSPAAIGVLIGRHKETVRQWLIHHGAHEPGRTGGRRCTLPVERIKELSAQGMGPWEIARAINRSRSAVYMWMVRNGVHEPYKRPVRSVSRAMKRGGLPGEVILALEALPVPPPPTKVISDMSGYAKSTVRCWLNGTRTPRGQALEDLMTTLRRLAQPSP